MAEVVLALASPAEHFMAEPFMAEHFTAARFMAADFTAADSTTDFIGMHSWASALDPIMTGIIRTTTMMTTAISSLGGC
jgi:hypothetical protein